MEEMELMEKYFRKELSPEETLRFNDRLASDAEFKRKVETEAVIHKALQFSLERERIKAYTLKPVPVAVAPVLSLDNRTLISVGATALAVWIFSTFTSSLTSLSPEYIKWVGLTIALSGSIILITLRNKTLNPRLLTFALFSGLLVFVTASGIDAINQGIKGIADRNANEAHIVPFTEDKAWWPTHSLEDSLDANRKQMVELRNQIKAMVTSRLSSGPSLNFGAAPMNYTVVVIPRSSTVVSGATYEAEIYLAASPVNQTLEMRVDGKPVPMEADPSGVMRGKVSFTASGTARKNFVAEIKLGDSIYTKVIEYSAVKPK